MTLLVRLLFLDHPISRDTDNSGNRLFPWHGCIQQEHAHPSVPSSRHARATTSDHTRHERQTFIILVYSSHNPYFIYRIHLSLPSVHNETMGMTRASFAPSFEIVS